MASGTEPDGQGNGGGRATADALLEQAMQHHRAGRFAEAAALYDAILAQQPDHPDALHLLGVLAHQGDDPARAVDLIGRAIAINPASPNYHNNFGVAASALGRNEDAVAAFEAALAALPDDPELHQNLGIALQKLGRYEDALTNFQAAQALAPDSAEAHFNVGNALQGLRRHAEAVACYERALSIDPNDPRTLNNLGMSLEALNRAREAVDSYRRAIGFAPDNAEFHNNLGNALDRLNRPDEALASYRATLLLNPLHANAFCQAALIARKMCDWTEIGVTDAAAVDHVRNKRMAVTPFSFLVTADDPALQAACAAQYVASRHYAEFTGPSRSAEMKGGKIRLGYFSETFRKHAVAYLAAELFERHDRSKFEISAFSYGHDDGSPVRRRLEAAFDEFHDVREASDREVVRRIEASGIDILVDLDGHTERNRLSVLAHRPAPVQAHFLGYPGTLGTGFIDYLFVDEFVVPPDRARYFKENLVQLPGSYQVNDRNRPLSGNLPGRVACGLPEQGVVFCCFNQTYKIMPQIFDIWMELLRDVPDSVLWLLKSSGPAERNLRDAARDRNVEPDRLVFAPFAELPDHLARLRHADLFLDTLPVNAHTTASDSLWAGVPVLTCAGRSMAARVAGSLLHAVGLPELVTDDLGAYAALARRLATDPARLNDIKAKLAANRTTAPLFDTDAFRRHIEAAYERIWERARIGEPPEPFRVPPHGA